MMSGIDYLTAPVEIREKLSFSTKKVVDIIKKICEESKIYGCVILSTCNRTEIYISCSDDFCEVPSEILIKYSEVESSIFEGRFKSFENEEAVCYLFEVACGLKSMITGDEQICSQINNALSLSRECCCVNSVLEVLFRNAVTAGKVVLSNMQIKGMKLSAANRAVEFIESKYNIRGKKCLVIGNGKMGRAAALLLKEKGGDVSVTLRSYHSGKNIIPKGCVPVDYSKRYEIAENADFIISATASPHYTITFDEIKKMKKFPKVIMDIAMPRDIDPKIFEFNQIECYNIDNLGIEYKISNEDLQKIYFVIEKYKAMFYKWYEYKSVQNSVIGIKKSCLERIKKSRYFEKYKCFDKFQEFSEDVSARVIDMIFEEMKNYTNLEILEMCEKNIRKKADLKK